MTTMNSPRASESGHWYGRDGSPQYDVMGANGKMRPATLRDARKLGLLPGVTSIIKCAAAPGLERWKVEQNVLAALTLPRVEGESNDALLARIRADADAQGREAREKGTLIHAAIQGHYEGKPPTEEFWPYVKGVKEVIEANFPERNWIAEKACANPMGYGTKADLSCEDVVLDFKGSEFDEAKAPALTTYPEHAMQLAATREARNLPGADCAIVYVSRNVPGLCRIIRIDEPELEHGWAMFCALHAYWCAKTGYFPQQWRVAA